MAINHNAVSARWSRRRVLAAASHDPSREECEEAERDHTQPELSAVTIQTEHHSPIAIHLASLNGFADNLSLSCENLPAYASCTFANGTIALSASQSIDSQVVIDTDSVLGYQSHLDGLFRRSYGSVLALLMPGCILLLVRPRIRPGILALIAGCMLFTSAGCGGGGNKSGNGGTRGNTGNPPACNSTPYFTGNLYGQCSSQGREFAGDAHRRRDSNSHAVVVRIQGTRVSRR
jgi:hypothetical protein